MTKTIFDLFPLKVLFRCKALLPIQAYLGRRGRVERERLIHSWGLEVPVAHPSKSDDEAQTHY